MKKLLLLLVILMMGCAPRTALHYYIHAGDGKTVEVKYYPIYVDKDFGEADKVAIAQAVEQWNFSLNGQVRLAVVDWNFMMEPSLLKENAWYILRVDSSCTFKPTDTPTDRTLAWANKLGGNYIYMIRDRMWNEDVKGIAMHELGHLLGSDHVGTYLMYYRFNRNRYDCVDYASAESVSSSQHLKGKMNYCVHESGQ
jgi:predicted Zn-dependent protease